jgi:hypothetical protein
MTPGLIYWQVDESAWWQEFARRCASDGSSSLLAGKKLGLK